MTTQLAEPQTVNEINKRQRRENRQVVTPYAFGVSDELLGTRLGSPARRGIALLIDLFCVTMLTYVHGVIFAALVAWAFFRAGNRLKKKKRFNVARIVLRFLAALLLFVVAMDIFEYAQESFESDDDAPVVTGETVEISGLEALGLTAKYISKARDINNSVEQGACEPVIDCWLPMAEEMGADLAERGVSQDIMLELPDALDEYLNEEELQQFREAAIRSFTSALVEPIEQDAEQSLPVTQSAPTAETEVEKKADKQDSATSSSGYSVLEWVKGIAADLGLGFGWAALYFSVFTAWWKGQTPGKKMLSLRVLKLDGSDLNLWESFERYGGYGAGLATGLLGFLQIYWDVNRQAIQDKISETLVIQTNVPKVQLGKES